MIEAVGKDAQGERLDVSDGRIPALRVGHDTGQVRDFGDPPAVVLTLERWLGVSAAPASGADPDDRA